MYQWRHIPKGFCSISCCNIVPIREERQIELLLFLENAPQVLTSFFLLFFLRLNQSNECCLSPEPMKVDSLVKKKGEIKIQGFSLTDHLIRERKLINLFELQVIHL